MKKFKSLMLAAIATAALAATASAMGHEKGEAEVSHGINSISGEIIIEAKYSSKSPDEGDATTTYDTEMGDVNIQLKSNNYALDFEHDDEGGELDTSIQFFGTKKQGDNYVKAFGELFGVIGNDTTGYGQVYLEGGNKMMSLRVGMFDSTEYYGNGLGVSRAKLTIDNDDIFETGENLVIDSMRGFQVDVNAGPVSFEVAVPFMDGQSGTDSDNKSIATGYVPEKYLLKDETSGDYINTNVTGLRPAVKFSAGGADVKALFYTLSFEGQSDDADPEDKTRSGLQLVGSFSTGGFTLGGFFQSENRKDGDAEVTPSALGAHVTVGVGDKTKVGASFDSLNNGKENAAEVTATRFSVSAQTPFFVDAVTLNLGLGTSSQSSDTDSQAGSATSAEAEWVYKF